MCMKMSTTESEYLWNWICILISITPLTKKQLSVKCQGKKNKDSIKTNVLEKDITWLTLGNGERWPYACQCIEPASTLRNIYYKTDEKIKSGYGDGEDRSVWGYNIVWGPEWE